MSKQAGKRLKALVVEDETRLLKGRGSKLFAHNLFYSVDRQNEPNLVDLINVFGITPDRNVRGDQANMAVRPLPPRLPADFAIIQTQSRLALPVELVDHHR